MEALLSTIVTWLSINFALPAIHEHPRIEYVPPVQMAALRYRGLAGRNASLHAGSDSIVALYHRERKTIYLPESWSPRTPAEISVLVHEMVHHLQNFANESYGCPQEMEKPAYKAQAQFLEQFGTNLEREFGIDGLTLIVRTNCMDVP
jgi:hypothetical protein